jgi:hypothetical protein
MKIKNVRPPCFGPIEDWRLKEIASYLSEDDRHDGFAIELLGALLWERRGRRRAEERGSKGIW